MINLLHISSVGKIWRGLTDMMKTTYRGFLAVQWLGTTLPVQGTGSILVGKLNPDAVCGIGKNK